MRKLNRKGWGDERHTGVPGMEGARPPQEKLNQSIRERQVFSPLFPVGDLKKAPFGEKGESGDKSVENAIA
jgi:hypothetical protein